MANQDCHPVGVQLGNYISSFIKREYPNIFPFLKYLSIKIRILAPKYMTQELLYEYSHNQTFHTNIQSFVNNYMIKNSTIDEEFNLFLTVNIKGRLSFDMVISHVFLKEL